MHSIIVTTYNVPNIIIALSSLRRYLLSNRTYQFTLTVHNDNPVYTVTKELVEQYLPLELLANDGLLIINQSENLGCFHARIAAVDGTYEHFVKDKGYNVKYLYFIDDDDVILNPNFSIDALEVSHYYVEVHRLLEVLTLIQNPAPDLSNKYIVDKSWKLGNVGIPNDIEEYYRFIQYLKGYLPTLYEWYGTKRILSPDDYFFMDFWHIYLEEFIDSNLSNLIKVGGTFSEALTYLEDRYDRYKVDEGIVDLRYSTYDDGVTTMQNRAMKSKDTFREYCKQNPLKR